MIRGGILGEPPLLDHGARLFIGASLSEPHIDEKYMRDSYIYIYIYIVRPSPARRLIQNI